MTVTATPDAKAEQRFACGYVIEFSDGGENEGGVLSVGSLKECQRVSELIPAVSYSGDRPVKAAYIRIVEWNR